MDFMKNLSKNRPLLLKSSNMFLLFKYFHAIALVVSICFFLFIASFLQAQPRKERFFKEVYRSSPIKNNVKDSIALSTQKAFHGIYEEYQTKVVFISTEKNIEVRQHPYFQNDPFFRRFFDEPESQQRGSQKQYRKQEGLGTGFIISSDGYICTNYHVVEEVDVVRVKVGDKVYNAKVIGTDKRTDIALLKINGTRGLEPAYFANSDNVKVGDWAIAIGNPFGLDRTFTVGVVSAIAREDLEGNAYIQTDASINSGNSGGPLLNINGEVIGMNRMIYSQTGGNLGIGFAIPINTVYRVIESLKKHGKIKRGYIGVSIAVLTPEFAQILGLKGKATGVIVAEVFPGGPADKAGMLAKDIILEVDGEKVSSAQDLLNIISETAIGKTIKLKLWRDAKVQYSFVTIRENGVK